MASIPEIYSLPDTFSNLGGSCSDQEVISVLGKCRASVLDDSIQLESCRQNIYEIGAAMVFILLRDSEAMEGWKTDHGTWSPKKLVSIPNTSQGNSPNSPKFVGTKTTMEFKPTDGSKAVVGMTRYNLLTTREDGDGLDLDEELSLCHVFPLEGKGSRSEDALDPRNGITTAELEELERIKSEIDSTERPPLAVDDGSVNVQDLLFADPSKSEPSKFWQGFTKIYTKNPKLMYAACNHCDTMLKLKGGSSCGTGSLRHHNDSCRCKPKQEQLPGNSSSMPIPSTALQAITEQLELV